VKFVLFFAAVLVGCMGLSILAEKNLPQPCWCWPHDWHFFVKQRPLSQGQEYVSYGSYGSEVDWNNPQHVIPLDYQQAQGKRIFYEQCVWCHADSTPAGPSNRSNVSPDPPLMNDGVILNKESDASLYMIIAHGGAAEGKSAMMPPYGKALTVDEIDDLIAYMRVIAVPEYQKAADKWQWVWRSKQ
jgi:mono/diheme cytochrome c family protein